MPWMRNGNGQLDVIKVAALLGPVIMLAILGWLFIRGMVETPEQKAIRIHDAVHKELAIHEEIDGHPVMVERVDKLQGDVGEIKEDVKANTRILNRIEAKLDNGR